MNIFQALCAAGISALVVASVLRNQPKVAALVAVIGVAGWLIGARP